MEAEDGGAAVGGGAGEVEAAFLEDVLGGGVVGLCYADEGVDGEVLEGPGDEGFGELGGVAFVPVVGEEPVADFDFGVGVVEG